jgi:pimeloyl-ACP methyl ester carboxylesterase
MNIEASRHIYKPVIFTFLFISNLAMAQTATPSIARHITSKPNVPIINWGSCGNEFPEIQCAKVKVPLDYRYPNGQKTELALARYPASDQTNKIGTVFVNPGGPGGSGVQFLKAGVGQVISQNVLGRFDVVSWDPRGVGDSTPVKCWDNTQSRDNYFNNKPPSNIIPYFPSQEKASFEKLKNISHLCFSRNQPILNHMSTADVARDLDLLREAVGDQQLTYLGYSYGTYIGQTYANMFPTKVRAIVLDGVNDGSVWVSGWDIKYQRTGSYDVLKEFFKLCDQAGKKCGLSGTNKSEATFDRIRNYLTKTPILINDAEGNVVEYNYSSFIDDSIQAMYVTGGWALYADFLGDLNRSINGNKLLSVSKLANRADIEKASKNILSETDQYDNTLDSSFGNTCADIQFPSSFTSYSIIGKYASTGSIHGPYWWWQNAPCASWPTNVNRYTGPWNKRTSSPVLVIGNFFDPATNYANAVSTSRLLKNSRLLSYAGWGHTAAYDNLSRCIDDYVSLYLLDGSLPPKDTVCPAEENPFTAATSKSKKIPAIVRPKFKHLPRFQ